MHGAGPHERAGKDAFMEVRSPAEEATEGYRIVERLGTCNIVLIGMMGAGKSSVGRRLAQILHLPFVDADSEIETAANLSVAEIFATYGEAHFRDGEQRVLARLLATGPKVLATGGGAFMNEETRENCRRNGIAVWLQAEVPVLLERVRKKSNRPLLERQNPELVLKNLLREREPTYALADLTVASRDGPHQAVTAEIVRALGRYLDAEEKT